MNANVFAPDIFVVGGGPAGLAAAIFAAGHGFHVTVADHVHPPIDKACGEGLMPDTLSALQTLGVGIDPADGAPFAGISFNDVETGLSVKANFLCRSGFGIRRKLLHARLVERAEQLGVALLWGIHVELSGRGEVRCEGEPVTARWIVGADGEASQLRKWVAPHAPRYQQIRFGYRQHFRMKPWSEFVEVYWSRGSQVVLAPVAHDEICVAVMSRNSRACRIDALSDYPGLTARIDPASASDSGRCVRTSVTRLRSVQRGRFALIGDASGSVDPLTGEGLGLAFRQASALVDALKSGDLSAYQAAHDRISAIPRLASRLMLLMDSRPWLRKRTLRVLADEPALFSRLLNTHVQEISPASFGTSNALRLGWRLLRPGWQG